MIEAKQKDKYLYSSNDRRHTVGQKLTITYSAKQDEGYLCGEVTGVLPRPTEKLLKRSGSQLPQPPVSVHQGRRTHRASTKVWNSARTRSQSCCGTVGLLKEYFFILALLSRKLCSLYGCSSIQRSHAKQVGNGQDYPLHEWQRWDRKVRK